MKKRTRNNIMRLAMNSYFIVACSFALLPILYALSVSFDGEGSLLSSSFSLIPKSFSLNNYKAVFTEEPVLKWAGNTLLLVSFTLALSLGAAIPAAYVFSRWSFPGRKGILKALLLLYS
ncbi:MAG: hypothetical protein ACI4S4_03445, partial [Candidatus Ornithospirochaeta sp.]